VWAAETDPVALNPITNSNFSSTQGFEHCYESLTAFDARLNIVPALAERWETPDPTTYVFHLRKGVKFHDGSDFLVEARTTIDAAQRKALYRDVQRLLLDDAPNVWLCNDNVTEALQAYVKGYTQSPYTYRAWGLKHAWLEK
jgi:ABC-type transport system substrate-binding protein